eukprot:jgi/Galph1/2781/GphlegSOOS_G1464.1
MNNSESSVSHSSQYVQLTPAIIIDTLKMQKRTFGAKQLSPKKMGLNAYLEAMKTDRVPCLFYYNSLAQAVAIAGDWTDWRTVHLTKEESTSVFSSVIDVPLGTHVYKFVADFGTDAADAMIAKRTGWQVVQGDYGDAYVLESSYMIIEISKPPPPKGTRTIHSSGYDGQVVQTLMPKGYLWLVFAACLGCVIGIASETIHAARTASYITLSNRTVPTTNRLFETPMPTRNSAVALAASIYLQLSCVSLFCILITESYGFSGLLVCISFAVTAVLYITSTALDGYTAKIFLEDFKTLSAYMIGLLITDAFGILDATAFAVVSYTLMWLHRGRTRSLLIAEITYLLLAIASYFLADVSMAIRAPFVSIENPLHIYGPSIPGIYSNNNEGLSYSPEPLYNSIIGYLATSLTIVAALLVESLLVFHLFSHHFLGRILRMMMLAIYIINAMIYLASAGLDLTSVLKAAGFHQQVLDTTYIKALVALDFIGATLMIVQSIVYAVLKTKIK